MENIEVIEFSNVSTQNSLVEDLKQQLRSQFKGYVANENYRINCNSYELIELLTGKDLVAAHKAKLGKDVLAKLELDKVIAGFCLFELIEKKVIGSDTFKNKSDIICLGSLGKFDVVEAELSKMEKYLFKHYKRNFNGFVKVMHDMLDSEDKINDLKEKLLSGECQGQSASDTLGRLRYLQENKEVLLEQSNTGEQSTVESKDLKSIPTLDNLKQMLIQQFEGYVTDTLYDIEYSETALTDLLERTDSTLLLDRQIIGFCLHDLIKTGKSSVDKATSLDVISAMVGMNRHALGRFAQVLRFGTSTEKTQVLYGEVDYLPMCTKLREEKKKAMGIQVPKKVKKLDSDKIRQITDEFIAPMLNKGSMATCVAEVQDIAYLLKQRCAKITREQSDLSDIEKTELKKRLDAIVTDFKQFTDNIIK